MPLRISKGARRYNDRITLTKSVAVADQFGHADIAAPVPVLEVYAEVRQMSSTKTMLTFQQADVVGLDIEFRLPEAEFDGILWRGHEVHFPTPEVLDNRGRIVRVSGWYQVDNPLQMDPPPVDPETSEEVQGDG
jgi:hypothetical protein